MEKTTRGSPYWGPYQNDEEFIASAGRASQRPPSRRRKLVPRPQEAQASPPLWDTGLPPNAWRSLSGHSLLSAPPPFVAKHYGNFAALPTSTVPLAWCDTACNATMPPKLPPRMTTASYTAKFEEMSRKIEKEWRDLEPDFDHVTTSTSTYQFSKPSRPMNKVAQSTMSHSTEAVEEETKISGTKRPQAPTQSADETFKQRSEAENEATMLQDIAQPYQALEGRLPPRVRHTGHTAGPSEARVRKVAKVPKTTVQRLVQAEELPETDDFESVVLSEDEDWELLANGDDDWEVIEK